MAALFTASRAWDLDDCERRCAWPHRTRRGAARRGQRCAELGLVRLNGPLPGFADLERGMNGRAASDSFKLRVMQARLRLTCAYRA